jgi:hypothetical protein
MLSRKYLNSVQHTHDYYNRLAYLLHKKCGINTYGIDIKGLLNDIFTVFVSIKDILDEPDSIKYQNDIVNGILNCKNKRTVHGVIINLLTCLDGMQEESKSLITNCINARNMDYKLDFKNVNSPSFIHELKINFESCLSIIYIRSKIDNNIQTEIKKYIDFVKDMDPMSDVSISGTYSNFKGIIYYICSFLKENTENDILNKKIFNMFDFLRTLAKKCNQELNNELIKTLEQRKNSLISLWQYSKHELSVVGIN